MDNRNRIAIEEPAKSQAGLWIVAGGLTLLLIGYHSMGGETEEKERPPAAVVATRVHSSTAVAHVPQRKPIEWPVIEFEDLLKNNPFQARETLRETVLGTEADLQALQTVSDALEKSGEENRQRREAMAEELEKSEWSVRFLFKTPQGTAALIGDTVVHEGDSIGDYQVIAIHDDGVVLQPHPENDGPEAARE